MNLQSLEAFTHQGPYLQLNEDSFFHDVSRGLFAVLDGFGGSGCGDQAVKEIIENASSFYGQIVQDPDKTMPFYYSPRVWPETNSLINAINYAHYKLMQKNSEKPMSGRAGSSALFMVLHDRSLSIISVGNCSCVINRNGSFTKLFVEDDLKFYGNNSSKPFAYSIPLNALGLYEQLEWKVKELKIEKNDQILIGTDGVFSWLGTDEFKATLLPDQDNRKRLERAAELANQKGNTDNQTLMLLQF